MSEDAGVTHQEVSAVRGVCIPALGDREAKESVDEEVGKEQPVGEQDPSGQIVLKYVLSEPARITRVEEEKHSAREVHQDCGVHGPDERESRGHVDSYNGQDVDEER
jgi:hypothetical protein